MLCDYLAALESLFLDLFLMSCCAIPHSYIWFISESSLLNMIPFGYCWLKFIEYLIINLFNINLCGLWTCYVFGSCWNFSCRLKELLFLSLFSSNKPHTVDLVFLSFLFYLLLTRFTCWQDHVSHCSINPILIRYPTCEVLNVCPIVN